MEGSRSRASPDEKGRAIVVEGSHASPEKGEGKKEDQRRHPAPPPEKRRAIICTIIALLNFSEGGAERQRWSFLPSNFQQGRHASATEPSTKIALPFSGEVSGTAACHRGT